jgi:C1A family cysteine protease
MKRFFSLKILVLLVMVFSIVFTCALLFASELDDVKAAIASKHTKWIADETSISKLPAYERQLRLGYIKHSGAKNEMLSDSASTAAAPSGAFDWRSYNSGTYPSGNYVTPVKDQGNCGSCWAFGTTAAAESYWLINGNISNPPGLDLSEQTLVSCGKAGSCSGGYMSTASTYIRNYGLPIESCFPYSATNNRCSNACSTYQTATFNIGNWSWVSFTLDGIKNALYTYGPLAASMDVYTDFFYYKTGAYEYSYGKLEGGHVILIVGYDDTNQCFIVKNSWGTSWGESGFFKIGYSQMNNVIWFAQDTIAYNESGPVCTYSISPTSQSFTASSGSGSFNVTASPGCTWTATSSSSWIGITSGTSGSGNGSVNYTVTANTGKAARNGYIYVKDATNATKATFTIKQQGKPKR